MIAPIKSAAALTVLSMAIKRAIRRSEVYAILPLRAFVYTCGSERCSLNSSSTFFREHKCTLNAHAKRSCTKVVSRSRSSWIPKTTRSSISSYR